MTLIVDAGVLAVQADARHEDHASVARILRNEPHGLITSEFAAAEADYLIMRDLGVAVELDFLDDLAAGTFQVECLTRAELAKARDLARRHRGLALGIADASLVILADRHRTTRIATLDQRAFRAVSPLTGGFFTILPADEP